MNTSPAVASATPQAKTPDQEIADLIEGLTPQEAFYRGWDYGGAANWQAGAATLREACARKAEAKGQTELATAIRALPVLLPSVTKASFGGDLTV